jgi:hypothetical protein
LKTDSGLQEASMKDAVSYRGPRISSMTPRFVLLDSRLRYDFVLKGSDFGAGSVVTIGGQSCGTTIVHNSSVVECQNVTALWSSSEVQIVAGGRRALLASTLSIRATMPSVRELLPSVAPTPGGMLIQVVGQGFGTQNSDIEDVRVGGVSCLSFTLDSDSVLHCTVPPGTGRGLSVEVFTRDNGQSPRNTLFSYEAPTITSVNPSYLMRDVEPELVVLGTNFGNSRGDIRSLTIGGQECADVRFVSPMEVHCREFDASGLGSSVSTVSVSLSVQLDVGGVVGSSTAQVLELMGVPQVTGVAPPLAAPGSRITVSGSGFGRNANDVSLVSVDGQECSDVQVLNPSTLNCALPQLPKATRDAAVDDPSILLHQPLTVRTRGGSSSPPLKISYAGGGIPLSHVPSHVAGWREAEFPQQVIVRWTYPTSTGITSFEVQTVSLTDSSQFQSSTVSPADTDVAIPTTDGSNVTVYRWAVFTFTTLPVSVRVRAVNAVSKSLWGLNATVPAACFVDQYLATHRPIQEQECVSCPEGAFCGGGTSLDITARPGYWRVPWSAASMGFQKCPISSSCLGHDPSQFNASSTGKKGAATRRQFAQGSLASLLEDNSAQALSQVGDPDRDEQCAEGYRGTLCASCAPGYTRWGKYQCEKCMEMSLVVAAGIGLILVLITTLAILTFNAVKSSLQDDSKLDVAAVKIGFSFFQTVSIAASFDLRWPESVRALFSSMSALTSVSSDVFSMDCMFQQFAGGETREYSVATPHGSLFLARSAVMLAIPLMLVLLTLLFWFFIAPRCARALDHVVDAYLNRRAASTPEKSPTDARAIRANLMLSRRASITPHVSPCSNEGSTSSFDSKDGDSKVVRTANPMAPPSTPPPRIASRTLPRRNSPENGSNGRRKREARISRQFQSQVLRRNTVSAHVRNMVFGDKHIDVTLSVTERAVLTVVVMLYMLHQSVTRASLELITCRNLGQLGGAATRIDGTAMPPGDGGGCSTAEAELRVSGDLELCCTESSVKAFRLGLGIPAILLYALGIPVGALALLWLNRKQLGSRRVRATLGFLYVGYRPGAFFWETVVMARKALIGSIAVLLAPFGASIQAYASIFLVVGLILLQMSMNPFRHASLNWLEMGSLLSAFVTFECGLFLTDPSSSDAIRLIATMGVLVMNLVTLLGIVGVVLWSQPCTKRAWDRVSQILCPKNRRLPPPTVAKGATTRPRALFINTG